MNWLYNNWLALTALVVSLTAAAISGFNTYLNWRLRRRKLKLIVSLGESEGFFLGMPKSKSRITVKVTNKGAPTTLTDLTFRSKTKGPFMGDIKGPNGYTFGRQALGHLEVASIERYPTLLAAELHRAGIAGRVKLSAVVTDNTQFVIASKPFIFETDKWLAEHQAAQESEKAN
jgi:hypothetical protein